MQAPNLSPAPSPSPGHGSLIVMLVAATFFMENLDGTIIATALPQMARSFGVHPADMSLGITAYLLTLAVFIPISGWAADRFGLRTVFGSAIAVFTAASVLCATTSTLPAFAAARVLQGIGGAMMVPVGRLAVLRATPQEGLMRGIAIITWPGLVAPVIAPPLGGFITTYSSWRWIFYLNVPIGLLGLAMIIAFMTEEKAEDPRRFDWTGFVLSGGGLALLMFGLDQLGRPLSSVQETLALIVAGLVVCIAAYYHLERAKEPLLDLSLFRIPTFRVTSLMAGTTFRVVIGAMPFLWPLLFQVGFGMNAFASGGLVISCAVGDFSMKFFSKRILRRFGFRRTLVVNGFLVGA